VFSVLWSFVICIFHFFWNYRKWNIHQEWPHPVNTTWSYRQNVERTRQHAFILILIRNLFILC
jgi:hypothetical protein